MKHIILFTLILYSFSAFGQSGIRAGQVKAISPYTTNYIFSNDTVTGSSGYKFGKWIKLDSTIDSHLLVSPGVRLSDLLHANKANTIYNKDWSQIFRWDSLAAGTGLSLQSSGTLASSNTQTLLSSLLSGTNATSSQISYAGYFSNTHTGTTPENYGIFAQASSTTNNLGAAGWFKSTNGSYGIKTESVTGTPILATLNSSTTNTSLAVARLERLTSGTAAAGIGGILNLALEDAGGTNVISNQLKWSLTTATAGSQTSQLILTGINAGTGADLFTLKGSGQLQLNKYGVSTFTGTPVYNIVTDASGNLIESPVPVGSNNITEENNASVQTGTITYDFQDPFDVATDGTTEVNISFDGSEFSTITSIATSDFFLLNRPSGNLNKKITYANLITDIIADVGGADGNGIFSSSNDNGTVPTDMDVLLTDHIDFGVGTLYVDGSSGRVGVGTTSPGADLDVSGAQGSTILRPNAAGGTATLTLKGRTDGGGSVQQQTGINLNYIDTDYAGGVEQSATNIIMRKESDASQWSTFQVVMPEATDADVFVAEKQAAFSDNTTESHIAINGGIAFTQNYEWTATSVDLTLDRSYNIVNVSGSGGIGDEINLPEVNSTADNWDSALTSAQVQVGQEYTITNFRAATNLVIRAFTGDEIDGTGVTNISLVPFDSVILKCVRFSGGVGYWKSFN